MTKQNFSFVVELVYVHTRVVCVLRSCPVGIYRLFPHDADVFSAANDDINLISNLIWYNYEFIEQAARY